MSSGGFDCELKMVGKKLVGVHVQTSRPLSNFQGISLAGAGLPLKPTLKGESYCWNSSGDCSELGIPRLYDANKKWIKKDKPQCPPLHGPHGSVPPTPPPETDNPFS